MQFICTLYRNMSANVLCREKALNVELQKGQRGTHRQKSVFCSLKSRIATGERDVGREREDPCMHTIIHISWNLLICASQACSVKLWRDVGAVRV